jgi:hypothetical protein
MKLDHDLAGHLAGAYVAWGVHHAKDVVLSAADLDLGPLDFRYVIDLLRMDHLAWQDLLWELEYSAKGILGVRMNCEGDRRFLDRPLYEKNFWPKNDLQGTQIAAPVADRLGLPLIVRKIKPAGVWRDRADPSDNQNYNARLFDPAYQTTDTGSLVVVRKDGKPLHPLHVHALLDYMTAKMVSLIYSQDASNSSSILCADLLDHVSREDFEQYYLHMVQNFPARADPVPSPYEVDNDNTDYSVGVTVDEEMTDSA